MNDDERLAALFRDAASDADAPPPAFSHDDVVAVSRRITARRRSAAVAAAAVIGLAGLGAAIILPGEGGELTSAAAPAPEAARDAGDAAGSGELSEPYAADSGEDAGSGSADPRVPNPAAAPAPPTASPLGPAEGPCASHQDPDLRALVEEVLPEAAGAAAAVTTEVCLPGTDRYLALEVTDGTARGVLRIGYLPPGTIVVVIPGTLTAPTASGGTVLVGSTAEGGGPDPYADRLQSIVDHLAPRL